MKLLFPLAILFAVKAMASVSGVLTPQAEYVGGHYEQAKRGSLKTQSYLRSDDINANLEFFVEYDGANEAKNRRSQNSLFLQEASLEKSFDFLQVKLGRFPVRWSESWVVPSLDVWTARRWNRLFFDPLSEQLSHPTGALVGANWPSYQVEFLQVVVPARDKFPKPLPEGKKEEVDTQWGVRSTAKLLGFDVSIMLAEQSDLQTVGSGLSYAFDAFVLKTETAGTNYGDRLLAVGADIFISDFTITPQWTGFYYDDPVLAKKYQNVLFLATTYTADPYRLELQWFRNTDLAEWFGSLRAGYLFENGYEVSTYYQSYRGNVGTLFGLYERLTGDYVIGLKLFKAVAF